MKQVDVTHYNFDGYITKKRFISFWCQVREVMRSKPKRVLEIGPGPGVVTDILRRQGVDVVTVDFADDVGADVVASVLDLPFADGEFDVVLCCQVLEHLEYSNFSRALGEIRRVCSQRAIISLPNSGRYWVYSIWVPKFGEIMFGLNMKLWSKKHVFDGEHYWEIGKRGYGLGKVKMALSYQFDKFSDFRLLDNPYHHFFICSK